MGCVTVYSSLCKTYLRSMEHHLTYRITRGYTPPNTDECVPP